LHGLGKCEGRGQSPEGQDILRGLMKLS
jgi:hypothetical protein